MHCDKAIIQFKRLPMPENPKNVLFCYTEKLEKLILDPYTYPDHSKKLPDWSLSKACLSRKFNENLSITF